MQPTPPDSPRTARHGALAAAGRWRLPFSRQAWRGLSGNWLGVGAGSSLDFQDHRNYVPGDDPRHIHWQAFARTGALTMKLYRAEVAPVVDVVVDVSASMSLTPEKTLRVDELVAFCVECADRAAAPVRLYAATGRSLRAISPEEVRGGRWRERLSPTGEAPGVSGPSVETGKSRPSDGPQQSPVKDSGSAAPFPSLPWRPGSLKVLISDLLFPGEPSSLLVPLAASSGVAVVLTPALAEEADLSWRGNVELTDCETGTSRRQRIDEALADRYRIAYARHFSLWREAARARRALLARVPCEGPLSAALGGEPWTTGAVEPLA